MLNWVFLISDINVRVEFTYTLSSLGQLWSWHLWFKNDFKKENTYNILKVIFSNPYSHRLRFVSRIPVFRCVSFQWLSPRCTTSYRKGCNNTIFFTLDKKNKRRSSPQWEGTKITIYIWLILSKDLDGIIS